MLHTDMKRLYVLYIPGLGDENIDLQAKAVNVWRWFGVKPDIIQIKWSDTEPWNDTFVRLLARIDAAYAKGYKVALVGASAGATAVINAYAVRQTEVVGCVLIAGKVNHPETIGKQYNQSAPKFVEAAYMTPDALASLSAAALKNINSRYALFDNVVSRADSYIPSARNTMVYTVGHAITIAVQLAIGAPRFLYFLKRRATQRK
jgi:predicted alpha/beta hydrolase family esterase